MKNDKPFFVGIAGGTGSGKSSLCFALEDKYPGKVGILHLDDYFKRKEEIPKLKGLINLDSPKALDFDQFIKDIKTLKKGESIVVQTKSERHNPNYRTKGKIPLKITPKPIMLVE